MDPMESRRVWHDVTEALRNDDLDAAAAAKHIVSGECSPQLHLAAKATRLEAWGRGRGEPGVTRTSTRMSAGRFRAKVDSRDSDFVQLCLSRGGASLVLRPPQT